MKHQQGKMIKELAEYKKIEEIKAALSNIDTTYFKYDKNYKKHILNIAVQFRRQSYNISDIPVQTRNSLISAGNLILNLLKQLPKGENINYLIIIEGQASKDNWSGNDELSYQRALTLKKLWIENKIKFFQVPNCELVVAGSGQAGVPRIIPDIPPNNQRFLIHIIPKVGQIEYNAN